MTIFNNLRKHIQLTINKRSNKGVHLTKIQIFLKILLIFFSMKRPEFSKSRIFSYL